MENSEHPQQIITQVENLMFFSNFDSGNLAKVTKVSMNSVKNN